MPILDHATKTYQETLRQGIDTSAHRTRFQFEDGEGQWLTGLVGLPDSISPEVISGLIAALTTPLELTKDVLEVVTKATRILEQIAILIIDPLYFAISKVIKIFQDLIASIVSTRITTIFTHSTLEKPLTIAQQLGIIGESVLDRADIDRPVVDQLPISVDRFNGTESSVRFSVTGDAHVYLAFGIIACPGIQSVYALIDVLKRFIDIPDFVSPQWDSIVVKDSAFIAPKRDFQAPDWEGRTLAELVPEINNLYIVMQSVLDVVLQSRDALIDQIERLVEVIELKVQQLEDIVSLLDSIIEAIVLLLTLGPIMIYQVEGNFSPSELQEAINTGAVNSPFGDGDFGVVFGLGVSYPFVDSGDAYDEANDLKPLFDSTKAVIQQLLGV